MHLMSPIFLHRIHLYFLFPCAYFPNLLSFFAIFHFCYLMRQCIFAICSFAHLMYPHTVEIFHFCYLMQSYIVAIFYFCLRHLIHLCLLFHIFFQFFGFLLFLQVFLQVLAQFRFEQPLLHPKCFQTQPKMYQLGQEQFSHFDSIRKFLF